MDNIQLCYIDNEINKIENLANKYVERHIRDRHLSL